MIHFTQHFQNYFGSSQIVDKSMYCDKTKRQVEDAPVEPAEAEDAATAGCSTSPEENSVTGNCQGAVAED